MFETRMFRWFGPVTGMGLSWRFDEDVANEALTEFENEVRPRWPIWWPKIYEAIMRNRGEYGRDEPIDLDEAVFKLIPLGLDEDDDDDWESEEPESWTFICEDGGDWSVDFDLEGTRFESHATF